MLKPIVLVESLKLIELSLDLHGNLVHSVRHYARLMHHGCSVFFAVDEKPRPVDSFYDSVLNIVELFKVSSGCLSSLLVVNLLTAETDLLNLFS